MSACLRSPSTREHRPRPLSSPVSRLSIVPSAGREDVAEAGGDDDLVVRLLCHLRRYVVLVEEPPQRTVGFARELLAEREPRRLGLLLRGRHGLRREPAAGAKDGDVAANQADPSGADPDPLPRVIDLL